MEVLIWGLGFGGQQKSLTHNGWGHAQVHICVYIWCISLCAVLLEFDNFRDSRLRAWTIG